MYGVKAQQRGGSCTKPAKEAAIAGKANKLSVPKKETVQGQVVLAVGKTRYEQRNMLKHTATYIIRLAVAWTHVLWP